LPLYDISNPLIVHLETFAVNVDSEELYLFLVEFTFPHITEEFHILQTLKGIADPLDMCDESGF
jgi:hypothetical protein